jgi:hypothetical protein
VKTPHRTTARSDLLSQCQERRRDATLDHFNFVSAGPPHSSPLAELAIGCFHKGLRIPKVWFPQCGIGRHDGGVE